MRRARLFRAGIHGGSRRLVPLYRARELPREKSSHHGKADAGDDRDGCECAKCQHHNFVFRFLIHVELHLFGA
jgi:hypothetical protein